MESKQSLLYELNGCLVEASHGESVLDSALRAQVALDHSCGGNGTCGTCRVVILKGGEALDSRNEIELELATDRGFASSERLACQIVPKSGLCLTTKAK